MVRTHWRRWHLGHDVFQFAIVLAATAAIAALVAFEHGKFRHVSWWDYHGYLLAGFGGAVYAVFRRRGDERTLTDVLNSAFVDDPFEHIVSGYPEALRSLVRAVEVKDTYTHGHSERTARLAVELGLSMGLAPDRLRVIARGAYLHDVGKIGIPDEILNKPDALTPEEWKVIQTHPQLGYELASAAPSLHEALPVILHHHERIDGGGYPAGLAGTDIPLEARVVAVADVWDALTSDRAYRNGWAPDDGAGPHPRRRGHPLRPAGRRRARAPGRRLGHRPTTTGGAADGGVAGRRDLPRARRRPPRLGLSGRLVTRPTPSSAGVQISPRSSGSSRPNRRAGRAR